jgi:hypothetical protein
LKTQMKSLERENEQLRQCLNSPTFIDIAQQLDGSLNLLENIFPQSCLILFQETIEFNISLFIFSSW